IPSARPPHKDTALVSEPHHRLAMARLAVADDPMFDVSDIECHRDGPSYTFDTVQSFRKRLGDSASLFWIIGADSLPELPTWHRISDLVGCVTIITATRPGWRPADAALLARAVGNEAAETLLSQCYPTPAIEISATDIRERVSRGRPIRYLTPEPVRSYIEQEGLYRN
ncbi:MAG: nicotinate (nicotinamide) nucleotide adenylyltransferase, partial [Phycisphaerae bacterium]